MAQDVTQQHPNARWWNGANAAGGGRAPGDGSGSTTPTGTAQYQGEGPGTVYIGRNAAGVSKRQLGPNAAGMPKAVTQP